MTSAFEKAMKLAAVSGFKIALGPAFLASSRREPERGTWVAAAVGEMLLDTLGITPGRRSLALLIPHTVSGAWVAKKSLEADGEDDPMGMVAGAVVAAGVATLVPALRGLSHRVLGVPDVLLGVAEDYCALQLGCEAVGMSMDEVSQTALDVVEDWKEQVMPALQSVGAGSM